MKQALLFVLFAFAVVGVYGFAFSMNADEPAGKKVFVDQKCNNCHSIESQGITKVKKNDLSKVGASHKADFFGKYLQKQEKIDGKEHKVAFKGTDQELKDLAKWLETLK